MRRLKARLQRGREDCLTGPSRGARESSRGATRVDALTRKMGSGEERGVIGDSRDMSATAGPQLRT
jgi:hypothetical protein